MIPVEIHDYLQGDLPTEDFMTLALLRFELEIGSLFLLGMEDFLTVFFINSPIFPVTGDIIFVLLTSKVFLLISCADFENLLLRAFEERITLLFLAVLDKLSSDFLRFCPRFSVSLTV